MRRRRLPISPRPPCGHCGPPRGGLRGSRGSSYHLRQRLQTPGSVLLFGCGGEYGLHRLLVPGAEAQVPGQRLPHLVLRRVRTTVQQRLGADHHAGGAEAALHRAVVEERLLHGIELAVDGDAFDGQDVAPFGLRGKHQAGVDGLAVHQNRARPAFALLAAAFDAEIASTAQHVEQQLARSDTPVQRLAVHGEMQFHAFHNEHPTGAEHSSSARLVSTEQISRRYSAEARASEIGRTSRATSAPISASRAWSRMRPAIRCSAPEARMGAGATDPSAIRAHFTRPLESSCSPADTFTSEISTAVRPNFWKDHWQPLPGGGSGMTISTSSALAWRLVRAANRYSASGSLRRPFESTITTAASSTSSGVAISAADDPD